MGCPELTERDYYRLEKLDALNSNAVIRKRIWSDGKVICDIHGSTPYYALGDANKNITEYLSSTGAIQAHFEYSPFGKITVASGSDPDDFDFRFSSEVFEHETGLVYYNYRYYSPELGRWITRDPIGERGGWNLYGMAGNRTINRWDNLGWDDWFFYTTPAPDANAQTILYNLELVLVNPTFKMQKERDNTCFYPDCTRYRLSCSVEVSIKGDIAVKMPILHNRDELSERGIKAWDCWYAALQEHEDRHVIDYEDSLRQTTTVKGYVEGCSPEGLASSCSYLLTLGMKVWIDNFMVSLDIQSEARHMIHPPVPPTPYHCLD